MLVEAIAIARAGQYLMKAGKRFFVVAIYLRKNLTAERFIVAQSQDEKVRRRVDHTLFVLMWSPGIYFPERFRPRKRTNGRSLVPSRNVQPRNPAQGFRGKP